MAISKFKSETLRTVAFGSIGAAFSAVGTAFTHPISKIYIVNDTDVGVIFSDNGSANTIYLPNGMDIMLDITIDDTDKSYIAKGSLFYVKQGPEGAASSGLIALSAFYED